MAKATLAFPVQEARGALGNVVLVLRRGQPYLRSKPTSRSQPSPAQSAQAQLMRLAARYWSLLTPQQVAAWNDYAQTASRHADRSAPTGQNAFTGHALVTLKSAPGTEPSPWPPASAFHGDPVTVSASAQSPDRLLATRQPESRASGPDTRTKSSAALPEPAVTFQASGPNSPGVLTELLVQKLNSPACQPSGRYTSLGYVTFASQDPTCTVHLPPGAYALAYRFVRPATGQASLTFPIGTVTVMPDSSALPR